MKKTVLSSLIVGSLLTTLAIAEQPRLRRPRGLPYNAKTRTAKVSPSAKPSVLTYVITVGFEFGAIDLNSGAFLPIGPGLPPDVGDGLVPGTGKSLFSLGFTGNLDAIDPTTGQTTVIGATGLGDCSTPTSPCGPNSALWIGLINGHYYVTDFANNVYSLDPKTAATKLIGPTGMPGITSPPFSENPDGSVSVFGASLFGARGKFYAYFATLAINFEAGTFTPMIPGAIYEIDEKTGRATKIADTDTTLSAIVNRNETIYAFNAWTGQVVTLDPTTGETTPVSDVDPEVGPVAGAAPARPSLASAH